MHLDGVKDSTQVVVCFHKPSHYLSYLTCLYQWVLGKEYWEYAHTSILYRDCGTWYHFNLTWDGLVVTDDLTHGLEDVVFALPLDKLSLWSVPIYKRISWFISLAKHGIGTRLRYSPLSSIPMLLGKCQPWFNCSSILSYVILGYIVAECPSDLFEYLIEEEAYGQ